MSFVILEPFTLPNVVARCVRQCDHALRARGKVFSLRRCPLIFVVCLIHHLVRLFHLFRGLDISFVMRG